jgi:hypothetical protein
LTSDIDSVKKLLNTPIPELPDYEPADSVIEDYYLEEARKFGKGGMAGMQYST